MRVTSLIENDRCDGRDDLRAEFGLSLHIEAAGRSILFDTGSSSAFADNAEALGVDLSAVDLALLSHHHFDHGGGLQRFLDLNDKTKVHLREAPLENRWFKALLFIKKPIGIDRSLITRAADRFVPLGDDRELAPGVWALTKIGTKHPRPKGNDYLMVERDGSLEPDPFDHELVLVVREDDGIVVFTGCSHSGILNMVDAAREKFPDDAVKAVFGGFHLVGIPLFNSMAASPAEVEEIGRLMLEKVSGPVYTGHCTGKKAYSVLAKVMGDALRPFSTGATTEI